MSRRIAGILAILLALIVAVAWFFLLFRPAQDRIAEANDRQEQAENEALLLRQRIRSLERIEEAQPLYVAAVGSLDAAVPRKPEVPTLIDELEVLALGSGVEWLGVTFGIPEEVDGADYNAIQLSVTVEGQFFELLGYLYGIEDLNRLVTIETITLNASQDEAGFTILRAAIGARAYTTGSVAVPDIEVEEPPASEEAPTEEAPTEGDEDSEGTTDGATDGATDNEGDGE